MNIFQRIGWWFSRMFSKQHIKEAFGVDVFAISPTMQTKQELYRNIVKGTAPWNDENTPSLRLATSVSAEVASRVALGLKSEVTGSIRADYLNEQFKKVADNLYHTVIAACNGGELIFKPYMIEGGIEVTISETDCYLPVTYNARDELIDVIFGASVQRDKYIYKLLEHHTFDETAQTHTIIYRAFKSEQTAQGFMPDNIGVPVAITDVPEWAHLLDITIQSIEKPLFALLRMPTNDSIERPQRQGLPIWSKTIENFRKADKHEARTDWEFEGGELAVDAPLSWFKKDADGNPILPEGRKRLFRVHENRANPDADVKADVFAPEFRIDGLDKRMNQLLRRIEFDCGLSYGILSDNNAVDKTAEEFKKSQARLITTISTIQTGALQPALEHLIDSLDVLADLQGVPQGDYETMFEWSEAYAIDREAEAKERLQWQAAGNIHAYENRAWFFDVPEDSELAQNVPKGIEDEF